MAPVTNISAYRFAPLDDLKSLRERLLGVCREWQLKGTILLSTEGINLFVAGFREQIDQLLALLRTIPGLEKLEPKVSESQDQPFTRMLVKIKKEIITFGVPGIDPAREPAPRLSPRELKQWLDEGRPLTLLDTRNDYEVNLGTFSKAVPIGIRSFREFPGAVNKLDPDSFQYPIITFCTGGIRCEKAAPYLLRQGFEHVYQLDGGILKYFEECGSDHYNGECFVFDKRVGLEADLDESGRRLCFVCQCLLTAEEWADPRTVEGVSCPHCYQTSEEKLAQTMAERQTRLLQLTNPLPGQKPQDNYRPLKVSQRHEGMTILDFLCDIFGHVPREHWQACCAAGDIVKSGYQPVANNHVVHAGERYYTHEHQEVEPEVNARIQILFEDNALIVVNKPAPLPMHPSGRYNRNTLQSILCSLYAPQKPRPAHRLDANTSGIAVFTRTSTFARRLQPQFEKGQVGKRYLARVMGHPPDRRFPCDAPIAATAGQWGARIIDPLTGLAAHTDFEILSRDTDGTALIVAIPRTGRTNQIRVHLWHLGYPILGDPMYLPDRHLGEIQTLTPVDPPLHLHAWELEFLHPQTGNRVTFSTPRPTWAQ